MEFKKIINIGVIVSVVALSGVVAYEITHHDNKKVSHRNNKEQNENNTKINTNGLINGASNGENCDNQFYNGIRPVIENTNLKEDTRELCFKGFAVLHSGITRSPLYSVENLTRERVLGAKEISREDDFHEETRLPENERATLKDFARSGYDRGHLAPSDDMSDMQMQEESFSLANMVMQDPKNNRVLHVSIEKAVRKIAEKNESIYVGTGIAFTEDNIEKKGNVMVPHYIWKAVYIPKSHQASAYWEKNDASFQYEVISMTELKKRTGIDVFPKISQQEKDTLIDLPKPKSRKVK